MLDEHVTRYADVLKSFTGLSAAELQRRAIAILGAANALSDAMTRGLVSKTDAVDDLARLIATTIGQD